MSQLSAQQQLSSLIAIREGLSSHLPLPDIFKRLAELDVAGSKAVWQKAGEIVADGKSLRKALAESGLFEQDVLDCLAFLDDKVQVSLGPVTHGINPGIDYLATRYFPRAA